MMLTIPISSSSVAKITPFAMLGRERCVTIPFARTFCRPLAWVRSCSDVWMPI